MCQRNNQKGKKDTENMFQCEKKQLFSNIGIIVMSLALHGTST